MQDASGYSSLHHAALNGHRYVNSLSTQTRVVQWVYSININTPLVALLSYSEIVALLLEHEASPNITDSKGSSPLHLAAWAGHADIVRVLLTAGVRVTQINLKVSLIWVFIHCVYSAENLSEGKRFLCSQESSGAQDNTTKDFSNLNRNDQSADTVKQNSSKSLTGSCERLSIDSVSVCVVQGSLATPPTLSRSGNPPID